VVYGFHPLSRWRYRTLPGPAPSWLFGNLNEVVRLGNHEAYTKWHRMYGPVYKACPTFSTATSGTRVLPVARTLRDSCFSTSEHLPGWQAYGFAASLHCAPKLCAETAVTAQPVSLVSFQLRKVRCP
jgi:hypothetical protein